MLCGGCPEAFWEATPCTVTAVLQARRLRDEEHWRQAVTSAWMTAGLTRAREMPELDELLGETVAKERRGMSDAEIGHNIALWGLALDQQFGTEGTTNGG